MSALSLLGFCFYCSVASSGPIYAQCMCMFNGLVATVRSTGSLNCLSVSSNQNRGKTLA